MRRLGDAAWLTFLLVVLWYGPELAQSAVDATLQLRPPRLLLPGSAAPEPGALIRVAGTLHLDEARICPPGWLDLGARANPAPVVFAPVLHDGDLRAWVRVPARATRLRVLTSSAVELLPVDQPMVRVGLDRELAALSAEELLKQLRICPTPRAVSPVAPGGRRPLLGTWLESSGAPFGAAEEPLALGWRMLLAWSLCLGGLLLARKLRRPSRGSCRRRPAIPSLLSLARRDLFGFSLRGLLCSLAFGAILALSFGILDWGPRALAPDLLAGGTGEDGALVYRRVVGMTLPHAAWLCGGAALRRAGAPVTSNQIHLTARLQPPDPTAEGTLIIFPRPEEADPIFAVLRRGAAIPVHAVGYASPLSAVLRTAPTPEGCYDIEGMEPPAPSPRGVRAALTVDPVSPAQYRLRLAGILLLALFLGAALAYLWTALRFLRSAGPATVQGPRAEAPL